MVRNKGRELPPHGVGLYVAGPLLDDGPVGIDTIADVQTMRGVHLIRDQVLGRGGTARAPDLGRTVAVAGLLQDRVAQTTATGFEAQPTSVIDDHKGESGGSARQCSANEAGY